MELFLHVRVSAEHGLCEALSLVAESIGVGILLTIAEHYAHATAKVSLWLAEDAYTGALFLEGIHEIILRNFLVILVGKDNGRAASVLQTDVVDRQTEDSTEMKFKLGEVCSMSESHHTRVMWTRRKLGEYHSSVGEEELYAPYTIACERCSDLFSHELCILEVLFRNLIWLP